MEYRTIIYNACRDGNLRRLQVFLNSKTEAETGALLSAKSFGTPPLVISARNGHVDVMRYLISKNADLNIAGLVSFDGENIEGAPSLWAAAAAGHFEIVKLLVESGADVNQTTLTNSTPLRGACFDGHIEIVKFLVEKGADVEISNSHGHTCLMIAAFRKQTEVVNYLLSVGANVNKKSVKGNTALHDAAEAGSLEILKILLESNALMQEDSLGMTPLLSAAALGHCHVVEFLVENTDCLWEDQVDGLQLLGATCVDKRRDLSAALSYWRRALVVLETQDKDIVTARIKRAPPIAAYAYQAEVSSLDQLEVLSGDPDALRMQALLLRERILGAVHTDTVYHLRYRGAIYADVGRFDRCIELWMHASSMQQKALEPLCTMTLGTLVSFAELFSFMLNDYLSSQNREAGVAQAPAFKDIFRVLQLSTEEVRRGLEDSGNGRGRSREETHCLRLSSDVDPMRRLCVTTLHLVCLICRLDEDLTAEGKEQELKKVLYRLIQMNPLDEKGRSLLHLSCDAATTTIGRFPVCRFPALSVTQMLLEVGADANVTDQWGDTPLHVILKGKVARPSIVRCLMQEGADVDVKNQKRESPLELLRAGPPMDVPVGRFLSLKCLAACAVRKHGVPFRNVIPKALETFTEMH